MPLAVDLHEDVVDEKPIVVAFDRFASIAEQFFFVLYVPATYWFAAYRRSSLSQHIFNVAVAEIESEIQPNCATDDTRRKSVALVSVHVRLYENRAVDLAVPLYSEGRRFLWQLRNRLASPREVVSHHVRLAAKAKHRVLFAHWKWRGREANALAANLAHS